MSDIVWCGSGHRPNKLPFGYQVANPFELAVKKEIVSVLSSNQVTRFIGGGAVGWDTWCVEVCLEISIPYYLYLPFEGQEKMWPQAAQDRYHYLKERAVEVKYICSPGYAPWKMQKRNEAMANDCCASLVLWDGSEGGTGNFVQYAKKINRELHIINPKEIKYEK